MSPLTPNTTPVLLIIFNRPEKVKQLIEALSVIKPKHIYIAADGPRSHVPTDKDRCEETRTIASAIAWECEIHTNFQAVNLGCKRGVSTAITWFFERVPAGIILEDDCIPTPSFFSYCTELLERYRENDQIMHISGSTFIDPEIHTDTMNSYYFSNIPLIWGWASWRRAWNKYDIEMNDIESLKKYLSDKNIFSSKSFRYFWITLFRHIKKNNIDTWDGQWVYSILKSDGICITPSHNLIKNIGFDSDATHTTEAVSFSRGLGELSFPLTHPNNISIDKKADDETMKVAFVNTPRKQLKYFLRSLFNI